MRPIEVQAIKSQKALDAMFKERKIGGKLVGRERGPRYLSYQVKLKKASDLRKALTLGDEVALGADVENVIVRRFRGTLHYDFNLPDEYGFWRVLPLQQTQGNVIGVGSGNRKVTFDFNDDTPNWLMSGEMGSGKSVAIASALLSYCRRFGPEEFQFGLVDVHQDKYYAGFYNSSHLVAKPALTAQEVSDLILWFHNKLAERKSIGQADFEKGFEAGEYPRLVLVIDESSRPEVLGSEKDINAQSQAWVRDLVQEGRKFKIHVVVGVQKPMEKDLPGIFSMLGARMIGYTEATHITKNTGASPHLLTKKGDFLRVHGGSIDRFLWAYPSPDDYDKILTRVETMPTLEVRNDIPVYMPAPQRKAGRPQAQIKAAILGAYMGEKPPSVRAAHERFNVGYEVHKKYIAFARELRESMELEKQR